MIEVSDDALQRYEDITRRFINFAELAAISAEKYKEVVNVISKGLKELQLEQQQKDDTVVYPNGTNRSICSSSNPCNHGMSGEPIKDSNKVWRVERPPTNRKVSIKEKITTRYKRKAATGKKRKDKEANEEDNPLPSTQESLGLMTGQSNIPTVQSLAVYGNQLGGFMSIYQEVQGMTGVEHNYSGNFFPNFIVPN